MWRKSLPDEGSMMSPEQQAAFIFSQSASALIEAMAMQAENQLRAHRGEVPAYTEGAFRDLIDNYSLGYNSVIGFLHGR
jgi:hypothetical protein